MALNRENLNQLDLGRLQQQSLNYSRSLPPLDDEFFAKHQAMIEAIASAFVSKGSLPVGVEFDDLVSWGGEGLIKAYRNYNVNKGSSFKTYAYYRIRGEMYDHVRLEWHYRNPTDFSEQRRLIQERIADVVEEALSADGEVSESRIEERMASLIHDSAVVYLLSLDGLEDLDGQFDTRYESIDSNYSDLWDEIKTLDSEERQIIELFYVHGMKQKEISERLNQSRSRVCRIHMKVLEKLKRRMLKKR